MTDADEQSSTSGRHLMAYRINRQVGIELLPTDDSTGQEHVQPVFSGSEGLQSISLTNFTGRLVFRRAPDQEDSAIFSDTTSVSNLGSVTPAMSEHEGDSNPPSNFLDEDTFAVADNDDKKKKDAQNVAAGVAGGAALGLAAQAFMTKDTTTTSAPPLPSTNAADTTGEGGGAAFSLAAAALMEPSKTATPKTVTSSDELDNMVTKGEDKSNKDTSSVTKPAKRKLANATGLLRKVLNATSVKRSIPASVRRLRNQRSSKLVSATPLHDLCEKPNVTLEELFECLNDHPNALKTKDSKGRFPLHIIGDNDDLITSDTGRDVATVFAGHLINEFPDATWQPDNDGFIPFARVLADWIDWANNQEQLKKEHDESSNHDDEPENADSNNRVRTKATYYTGHNSNMFKRTARSLTPNAITQHWHIGSVKRKFFPRVEIWEEVEWCLSMLSTEMDILGRNQNLPMFQRLRTNDKNRNTDDRTTMVDGLVSRLPLLLYTILLVDDDGFDSRQRILDMTICRRLVLCPSSVGVWIIDLLNHGGIPAKRAVDYLSLVSNASIEDFIGGYGAPHSNDWDAFNEDRIEVFVKVGNLKGIIASLVTLPVSETERAASTAAIWHTMSTKLSRHFVLGLVLIDLILHFTMMVSFRALAITNATINKLDVDAHSVVYFISIHYFLRKACEAWVLMTISFATFRGYFSNLWTIFDTLAIVLTLLATIISDSNGEDYQTGLNTLVVGLLWIKVLGFLKVVNKQMSTFILALTQILYDIRFFMIVLLVCVLMFGDMFYIAVSSKDNGNYCDDEEQESGAIEDFCTSSWASYLRVYVILLGDFELDDMTDTAGTTVLFIIFTIVGVVILLNVLIAVISDSYEKATMSSTLLFGRARVLYVAQNEALEEFLRPQLRETSSENEHFSSHKYFRKTIRWTVLLAIIGTAIYAQLFLIGVMIGFADRGSWFAFSLSVIMGVLLFISLWVVITFILDGILRDLLPDRAENVYDFMNMINNCLVSAISNWLFGLSREKVQSMSNEDDEDEEEWTGRMKYLENAIERVVAETKVELKAEMMEMRAEMHEHFDEDE